MNHKWTLNIKNETLHKQINNINSKRKRLENFKYDGQTIDSTVLN